jgi:hypothetical protein
MRQSGSEVKENERLVRNCKKGHVGQDRMPTAQAYMLRKNEGELSVTSIDGVSASADKLQQLKDVRAALHRGGFTNTAKTFYATTVSKDLLAATVGSPWTTPLRAECHPDGNEGHCLIFGLPPFADALAEHVGLELSSSVTEPATPEEELA